MRQLDAGQITQVVSRLCIQANRQLPQDMKNQIEACRSREDWAPAKEILDRIVENYQIAGDNDRPICQDTGMACVFLKIGQDVHISGDLRAAVDEGVRQGYAEGFLRKSVVRDPLDRVNTGDNTPAMMDVEAEALDSLYQGLSAYKTAQSVVKVAAINSVAFEFALVELENESDAQAVADIFQARVDYQVNGGAFYPQTTADWENAQIITHGNVVALIVAGTEQARAVEAFEKLFA